MLFCVVLWVHTCGATAQNVTGWRRGGEDRRGRWPTTTDAAHGRMARNAGDAGDAGIEMEARDVEETNTDTRVQGDSTQTSTQGTTTDGTQQVAVKKRRRYEHGVRHHCLHNMPNTTTIITQATHARDKHNISNIYNNSLHINLQYAHNVLTT